MALISCTECGNKISEKAASCPKCGAPNEVIICPECSAEINKNEPTCPNCGIANIPAKVVEPESLRSVVKEQKSTITAPPPTKKKGYGGIIVFGMLGIILVVIGFNVKESIESFSGNLDHWANRIQNGGNDPEYEAKKYGSLAAMALGGFFLLISLVKLIRR